MNPRGSAKHWPLAAIASLTGASLAGTTPALADTQINEMVAVIDASTKVSKEIGRAERGTPAASAAATPGTANPATDVRFRELFASWTALDDVVVDPIESLGRTSPEQLLQQPVISVPSRQPVNAGYVSSDFGWRRHPVLGGRRRHHGIDIAAPEGTPVYATADGMVERANYSGSYGNVIYLDHGSDLQTRYAHLSGLNVRDGQRVKKGDLIGFVGSTGRSTGPHLHYEVRVDGVAVDPDPYMKGAVPEVRFAGLDGESRISDASAGIDGRVRPGGGQGGR
ncbi:MAG: M23 family metallopeptidase [Erythrobacter sp.]|jgi:murein DD-endopeptidase MepM/ murein hydrolase activator NlpD|nr:M23 family metallopeptidase [Erythrobacter sp.]